MEHKVKPWKAAEQTVAPTRRRWWLIGIIAGVGVVVLGAGMAVVLVDLPPAEYHPAQLDYDERSIAAKQFYRQMMDFDDLAQSNIPFEFTFTAEQMNRYLASLDEIAALLPEGQAGRVQEMMSVAGMSAPAVAIKRGRLILMVRAGRRGHILSAELLPVLDEAGRLTVPLAVVRVGRLRVPRAFIRGRLERAKNRLLAVRAAQRSEEDVPGGLREADLTDVATTYAMRMVLAALDGEPIEPEGRYRARRLRLAGIDITPGEITVHVVPVHKQPAPSEASQPSSQASPSTSRGE